MFVCLIVLIILLLSAAGVFPVFVEIVTKVLYTADYFIKCRH